MFARSLLFVVRVYPVDRLDCPLVLAGPFGPSVADEKEKLSIKRNERINSINRIFSRA
jgi:hypothetical protein